MLATALKENPARKLCNSSAVGTALALRGSVSSI